MKGYLIERNLTGLEELPGRLVETPAPVPKAGQVLIDVKCTAMNFFDILQVQGKHQSKPAFPWMAGSEYAGVISASSPIPPGCSLIPGKSRVFGSGLGAFAEQIAVDWKTVLPMTDNMTFEEAAGLSVTYATSYAALVNRANIKAGEYLLIHAAAGGVGLAALQLGKALGAIVIATAGSQDKLDVCKRAGADYVLNYKDEGWQTKVKEITKGHGADVIYDPVGLAIPSLKCIAWCGRILIVGFAAGSIEKVPANLVLVKNVSIVGIHWGAYTQNDPEEIPRVWTAILKLFEERKVKGIVYEKIYDGLSTVPEALRALGARETWGKVIVRVAKPTKDSKL